jgi:FtsH-binding integral membrane protein
MPKPAPASFDAHDRQTLRTSVLSAIGPTLALAVLAAGASLSARVCQATNRPWIAALIALGIAASSGALFVLARSPRSSAAPTRFIVWMGIALEAYSLCVFLAFALALLTEVRCD